MDAKCFKLIIQDPQDMIIHNPSSLKVGIATRILLQDKTWMPIAKTHAYALADAMGQDIPNRSKEQEFINLLQDSSSVLSEDVLQHIHACLVHINKCSTYESERKKTELLASQHIQAVQGVIHASIYDDGSGNNWELLGQTNVTSRRRSSNDNTSSNDNNNANQLSNAHDMDLDVLLHDDYDISSDTGDGDEEDGNSNGISNAMLFPSSRRFSSNEEWIHYYSGADLIVDNTLEDYQKAWISLSLLASSDGQLLGEAYAKGYDYFRAW